MISPRAKILFLLVLFFALTVVLAIFGLVIASIFSLYPESVLSVWLAMPLAVAVGFWMHRGGGLLWPSVIALALLYAAIWIGVEHLPIAMPTVWCESLATSLGLDASWGTPVVVWTVLLFIYCFLASVLPVWVLLQPRDYINSQQLFVALLLLVAGIGVAGFTGQAQLQSSAPAFVSAADRPADAPPILPFLFITIACGAVSGFHCLVSSGTSSKQLANECDAQYVGYGSMLLEGALAVLVILSCCAGIGMGLSERQSTAGENRGGWVQPYEYVEKIDESGAVFTGRRAWRERYDVSRGWSSFRLGQMVGSFVEGGANFIAALGLPLKLSVGIIAVLVACFAATTLDTATRLQRYVVQELGASLHVRPLENKYLATLLAVCLAMLLAMMRGPAGADGVAPSHGTGGLYLWPLFGATNQLLAGMALMVTVFYLYRRNKPVWFALAPMIAMIVMPVWALSWQMFNDQNGWLPQGNYLLASIGGATLLLQVWMVVEAIIAWPRAKGVLEELLPPLASGETTT
jgi:carbon starvation protein